MDFKPGWYEIKQYANGSSYCMYFRNAQYYTMTCTVDANGRQFLRWADPQGMNGPGRAGQWLPTYKPLALAPDGDWWDNPVAQGNYKPKNPRAFSRSSRSPTPRELSDRATAVNAGAASGLTCVKEIHVGIFFDGTNNNRDRDRPQRGHSNVVSLFDAHKDDKTEHFAYYIPGVGTQFSEIGEDPESNGSGNTFAAGGEARIHYGMLQVFNAVCSAATGSDLFTAAEMKSLVVSKAGGLSTLWRLGDDKMVTMFRDFDTRLQRAIEGKRPKVCKANVSVIGFSRGAAQARTFARWLQLATGGSVGGAVFNLRFLGIFDTVASVALADSSPVGGNGFMDWADGTMGISVPEKTAHFVAAHEIRRSFPLSTARAGGGWPAGVKEFVFPGAHSDVGGGYSPGDQGKATSGRAALLSQIALNDMYHEALNAAMKVKTKAELPAVIRADFSVHPDLDKAFSDYARWTTAFDEKQNVAAVGGAPENRMRYHTQLYWRWRAAVSADDKFTALSSYKASSRQDQIDLWEAEQDWRRDVQVARLAAVPSQDYVFTPVGPIPGPTRSAHTSPLEKDLLKALDEASTVTPEVSSFFDRFVHDSHAGFWMLGPRTKLDKAQLIQEIKDKQAVQQAYVKLAEETQNPGRRRNLLNTARYYELNNFEKRVLSADVASPGTMPVFTDDDAAELRRRAGLMTSTTLALMGTATRREASGHGRYRRIFDQS